MTSKLLKYELKSGLRSVGIFWLALVLTAAFAGIMARVVSIIDASKAELLFSLLNSLSSVIYGVLIAVIAVITLVLIIQRFYKGLLQDEGYLMHTLPTTKSKLVASKQMAAIIIIILSILVITISAFIMNIISDPASCLGSIKGIFKAVFHEPLFLLYGFEFVVLTIASFLVVISEIYTSLSIGQLKDNHRILLSLIAFFIINVIMSAIGTILVVQLFRMGLPSDLFSAIETLGKNLTAQLIILAALIIEVVAIVIFNLITVGILKKKLNLQ